MRPRERAEFETSVAADPELRELVEALSEGAAVLAMSVAPSSPPEHLKERLMGRLGASDDPVDPARSGADSASLPLPARRAHRVPRREWLAWAAALAFAVGCGWFWQQEQDSRDRLARAEDRIGVLGSELEQARASRDLARFEVETLKATIEEYQEGVALVVWDEAEQEGVLKLEKMPPIPTDKDYQLWVVDPDHPKPVDAGVVRVDEDGFARVQFRPRETIARAEKFAISVERRGGVRENEGPIVLLSP